MAVRQRTWVDRDGKSHTKWTVDFVFKYASGRKERVREVSPVNTKVGAQEYERQLRNERLVPTKQEEKQPSPTLAEFEPDFMAHSRAHNKFSAWKAKEYIFSKHLLPRFGKHRLSEILAYEVDRFVSDLLVEGYSKKTAKNILIVLLSALNQAKKWDKLTVVPEFDKPVVPEATFDFLTFEEAERFEAAAYKLSPQLWGPMVRFALNTGLRIGELCELRWTDIDLKAGKARVARAVYRGVVGAPKGGKTRDVALNKMAMEALGARRSVGLSLVFCHPDGSRLDSHSLCVTRMTKISGLSGLGRNVGWHTARHSFASHLVMRGVSIKAVQELLGHASLTMTERYAHLSPNVKAEAVRALEAREPQVTSKANEE